jgi:hypothetical protein
VKRTMAALFAGVLMFTIFAGLASAATPAQRIAKLEKQVSALTKTVNAQKKTVNTQKKQITELQNVGAAALAVEFCLVGVTADAIQSTWTTLDQAAAANLFGPQQTISDGNACSALQISRQGIRTPPSTSVFSALTALLTRTAAFRLG